MLNPQVDETYRPIKTSTLIILMALLFAGLTVALGV